MNCRAYAYALGLVDKLQCNFGFASGFAASRPGGYESGLGTRSRPSPNRQTVYLAGSKPGQERVGAISRVRQLSRLCGDHEFAVLELKNAIHRHNRG